MYALDNSELAAAEAQGISAICEALEEHEVWTMIQNLGGHLMGAIATCKDGDLVITSEGAEGFVVGSYLGTAWEDGEDATTYAECSSQEIAIEAVRAAAAALGGIS